MSHDPVHRRDDAGDTSLDRSQSPRRDADDQIVGGLDGLPSFACSSATCMPYRPDSAVVPAWCIIIILNELGAERVRCSGQHHHGWRSCVRSQSLFPARVHLQEDAITSILGATRTFIVTRKSSSRDSIVVISVVLQR